ncbi:MAG: hypothetical protein SVM86_07835 [Candidatus Cloacimonadota bacterium]|nr:hypothetical protein [Candidatus Cloacimonadota bacterium]
MGTGELIILLFAIILFSTLFITYYNGLIDQADTVYNTNYYLQGMQIIEKFYQEIMVDIITESKEFSQIYSDYSNISDSLSVADKFYHYNITTTYCDSLGNNLGSSSKFQRLDFRVYTVKGNQDTVFIGNQNNPISKIIANTSIN